MSDVTRTILMVAGALGALGASGLLLFLADAAVKGTALLALAAIAAAALRRDSAATRHLVWLVAVVALLVVPALSAVLPGWRVLPGWAAVPPEPAVVRPTAAAIPAPAAPATPPTATDIEVPQMAEPAAFAPRATSTPPPAAIGLPDQRPASPTPPAVRPTAAVPPAARGRGWLAALPLVWAAGVGVLVLRLAAARLVLWKLERRATGVGLTTGRAGSPDGPILAALASACSQLGIRRPVALLIHPGETIPVVWGIFRPRLMLPASARRWGDEQLRSVLLHELAHVRRGDAVAQLLAQLACALHWFNPLAWHAAWQLAAERERACDDLVLASGVRPSAYAGHLLGVVAGLSPGGWTPACGLAMAGRSPIEGRLAAVLSRSCNRRRVSTALAAVALAVAAGVAVPVAMLRAADEKPATPAEKKPEPPKAAGEPKNPKAAGAKVAKASAPAKLAAEAEGKLQWGEPVNGLRAALAIRTPPDKPKDDLPDIYLAIQNASKAPVRLTDADVPADVNLRMLNLKKDGRTLFGLGAREPGLGDVTLQPGEVTFLPMFDPDTKLTVPADATLDKHTIGSHLAEDVLKDAHQSLTADLEIAKAPDGAWTGKLVTPDTKGDAAAGRPRPKGERAQVLYDLWRYEARANGDIPGGLVARLGDKVKEFIRNNANDAGGAAFAKKMVPLVGRFDGSRDWPAADAVPLLNDVAAAHEIPLDTAAWDLGLHTIRTGTPLPKALADAPWGEPGPGGLRLAWLLEPRADQYPIGTALKSRILLHNAGKEPVVFRAESWNQSANHQAALAPDAGGAKINIMSIEWLTLSRLETFRLWPGEFVELPAAGIGVGTHKQVKETEDTQDERAGSFVEAKAGDDVIFTPATLPLRDGNAPPAPAGGPPAWWTEFVAARLARAAPAPADAAERARLFDRAVMDLFGTPATAEERAAFVNDRGADPLGELAGRLAGRPGMTAFAGDLKSGPTRFRVLPPDPDAAKKPRVATGPGLYTLSDLVRLDVSRRPAGDRVVNDGAIRFYSADPKADAPGPPVLLYLPDGYGTWAAGWVRGGTVLWVRRKGVVSRYDFGNPAQVKAADLATPAELETIPQPVRDALSAALADQARSGAPAAPASPTAESPK